MSVKPWSIIDVHSADNQGQLVTLQTKLWLLVPWSGGCLKNVNQIFVFWAKLPFFSDSITIFCKGNIMALGL